MAEKGKSIIRNPKFRDSSSKLIFGDNTLSSQFFRDYADMEILRNVRPEDVEDVSERYVPLYSTERESDTVKKVDISRYLDTAKYQDAAGQPEPPLFIVSLVEHKTRVEYNVVMQILRYAVHIWEDYEKDMEGKCPGISSRKGFCYPPILPIVYYEGTGEWTAAADVAERIFCGELLEKYLPHFRYQLVRLHDYSNEALLANRDEISLAMLINKIQCPEDMSSFVGLSGDEVDGILHNTPNHLLEILARVLRTLLYSMNMPEDETEDAVAKIKERKMGRLFENVTMDIQAERRKAAQEVAQAREQKEKEIAQVQEQKEKEVAQARAQAQKEIAQVQEQTEKEVAQTRAQAQRQIQAIQKQADAAQRETEVYKQTFKMLRKGFSELEIRDFLMKKFALTETRAEDVLREMLEE